MLALAAPATASADDFYVDPGGSDAHGCTSPTTDVCKTIGAAVGKAEANGTSSLDTIHVAAGSYSEVIDLSADSDHASEITIAGAGESLDGKDGGTLVTYPNPAPLLAGVAKLGGIQPFAHDITLQDLTLSTGIGQGDKFGLGIAADNVTVRDVLVGHDLTSGTDLSTENAINVNRGPVTLDQVSVLGKWGAYQVDVSPSDGTGSPPGVDLTLTDSRLNAQTSMRALEMSSAGKGTNGNLTAERTTFVGQTSGSLTDAAVDTSTTPITLDSSVIEGGSPALRAFEENGQLRNDTIDAATPNSRDGGKVAVEWSSPGVNGHLTLDSSILLEQQQALAFGGATGSLTCTNSDVPDQSQSPDPSPSNNQASIACVAGQTGNSDTKDPADLFGSAPGFVVPDRYQIQPGSPAVDTGSSAALATGESASDVGLDPRVLDGNDDCVARRDKGAWELTGHENTPPTVGIGAPDDATVGVPVSFTGNATDTQDPVSALSFQWGFSDGGAAMSQDVSHAFSALGAQSASLTVADSHGCTGSAGHAVTVVPVAPGAGGATEGGGVAGGGGITGAAGPLPGPDRTPPVFTSASMTNRVFSPVGVHALAARTVPRGTTFRYSLSEDSSVAVAIERPMPGRRVGRRCVAPSPRVRRRPACTRYVGRGTLTQAAHRNANSLFFSGRLRHRPLAPARYRARFQARDGAGNRARERTLPFRVVRG